MNSPFKIFDESKNFGVMSSNFKLQSDLKKFFALRSTHDLWDIDVSRQRLTYELRNTKSISLRNLKKNGYKKDTPEYNKIMDVIDTPFLKVELFNNAYKWLVEEFKKFQVNIEFGRVFFSLHLPNSRIDLHRDTGPYFEYFDRFHFCIDTNDKNINYIRDEPIIFKSGFLYWFNNLVPHYLENNSNKGRINLIADVRLG